MQGDTAAAIDFLRSWDPQGPWVLTAIHPITNQIRTITFTRTGGLEPLARWIDAYQGTWNMYFSPGRAKGHPSKKTIKADIAAILALHVDLDPRPGEGRVQIEADLRAYDPPPSVIVCSGGGLQGYWLLSDPEPMCSLADIERIEAYNRRIRDDLGADHCQNIDRIMRLPGTINLPNKKKLDQGRQRAPAFVIEAYWDRRYSLDQFTPAEPATKPNGAAECAEWERCPLPDLCDYLIETGDAAQYGGDRSRAVFNVACTMVRCGCTDAEIARTLVDPSNGISAHVREQRDPERYAARQAERARECVGAEPSWVDLNAQCDEYAAVRNGIEPRSPAAKPDLTAELEQSSERANKPNPNGPDPTPPARISRERPWPNPLGEAAYWGLVGEIVRAIEPHTEADPAVLLIQFLVAFGNVVGRRHYYLVEATRHYPNIFGVSVGETAKARKGTSWNRVRALFAMLHDRLWERDRIESGLSSGEGLIWQVRDPITKMTTDKKTGETTEQVIDPGVDDKRLLVVESEFAGLLGVMGREGNIISRIVRDAWDLDILRTLTKNSPARATGAHISIIGHITRDELRRRLDVTETANGFANRFLFACARRSKLLPFGGDPDATVTDDIARRLNTAVERASGLDDWGVEHRGGDRLDFDDAAKALWCEVYPTLTEGRPGMLGAVTARAEAQTVRLALIYALLDGAATIARPHLEAALEIWRYCDESAAYIFGDSLGDDVADTILTALRGAPKGLTRSALRDLFSRHVSSAQLGRALSLLVAHGMARMEPQTTGGRPSEVWKAL